MRWLAVMTLALLIVGVFIFAGRRGKIRRHGREPWTLVLSILLLLLGLALVWATD